MQAAALLARESALDDEISNGRNVSKLEEIARHEVLPVVFLDFFLKHADAADRAFGVGFEQRSVAGSPPTTEPEKAETDSDPMRPPSQPPVMHVGNTKHR